MPGFSGLFKAKQGSVGVSVREGHERQLNSVCLLSAPSLSTSKSLSLLKEKATVAVVGGDEENRPE